VIRPAGSVVVLFRNNTDLLVEFEGIQAEDPNDLAAGTRVFTALVQPGQSSNEVLRCPTGMITLAIVDAGFAVTPTGAVVFDNTGAPTDVPYAGTPLVEGADYSCGDLISYTIVPDGAGFRIIAEVVAGR
jgi:hypothetical protein